MPTRTLLSCLPTRMLATWTHRSCGPRPARVVLWAVYLAGWALVVTSTFMINRFDLFGLRQVYRRARAMDPAPLGFRTPMLYRVIRHPIMTGFFIAFWATPNITWGHRVVPGVAHGAADPLAG